VPPARTTLAGCSPAPRCPSPIAPQPAHTHEPRDRDMPCQKTWDNSGSRVDANQDASSFCGYM
jgi:hypothetical protein